MTTPSPKFSVNIKDAVEAALFAALVSPLLVILTSISAGHFNINWTAEWQMALSNLAGYLIKQYFSGPPPSAGSVTKINDTAVKTVAVIVLSMVCTTARSQISGPFFGHLHYNPPAGNIHTNAIGLAPDSTYTGLRPTATMAVGYSNTGGTTILAFAGIGYFHVTHQAATNTFYTDWGISAQIGTGASNGAVSLSNATTVGLFGQFFNNLLTVGIGYNFANKTAIPLVGPGVAFH